MENNTANYEFVDSPANIDAGGGCRLYQTVLDNNVFIAYIIEDTGGEYSMTKDEVVNQLKSLGFNVTFINEPDTEDNRKGHWGTEFSFIDRKGKEFIYNKLQKTLRQV